MSWQTFVAVSCNHGDLVSRHAKRALLSFMEVYNPKHRIHLGDNWDLANLRRGADPREEGDDMVPDWNAGLSFIDDFKPTVFLAGNHDWRLWKAATDSRGLVRKYAQDGIEEVMEKLKEHKALFLPYHHRRGIHKIGDLSFLHGYHAGVNATRLHAQIYGKCVFGHLHRVDSARAPRLDRAEARCAGCLADFERMDYAAQRTATLAWENAWEFGAICSRTGRSVCWTAKRIGDKWLLPTGFTQV